MSATIEFKNVSKFYDGNIAAVRDVSLTIEAGECVFLSGPSGAGKSTLLKMIAAIERPDTGYLTVNGQDIGRISNAAIPFLRRRLGLILQHQNLLSGSTAIENVMLPLYIAGAELDEAEQRAAAALERVALLHRANAYPPMLSEGEKQRVAVARAIVNQPQIILADEPTVNLDKVNADKVSETLDYFKSAGVTCIIATHMTDLFIKPDRIIRLKEGQLVDNAEPGGGRK